MKTSFLFILALILFSKCQMSANETRHHAARNVNTIEAIEPASETAISIDKYLTAMESFGFSGAIIVSENDEVILTKGYGYANRETRKPYTQETIQTNGSITKQFTGAAIMLLESRGELSVEDPISNYLEPLSEEMQEITIHQLLTHSSGMPGGIGPDDEPIGAEAYLERLEEEPLQFEPGTGYAYSNTGYSLLGMIVEQVSGESYESFLRQELLLHAGMKNTGYILPEWDRGYMAKGYRNGELWGEVYNRGWIEDGPNWHLRANGGMHTTVGDMGLWLKTVQGRGVLNEDAARRWTKGHVTENNGSSEYGYGWVTYDHNRWGKVITHSGSNRIFEADFVWLPEREFFFYIQGNTSMFPAASEGGNILNAAFDPDFNVPPLVESDDSAKAETAREREGTYHLDGGYLEITADDTRLNARLYGQDVFDLMLNHTEEQKERFADLNQRMRIAMDHVEKGEADALRNLVREGEDPVEPTRPLLNRIQQIGNLKKLHVVGTFENHPGSRFAEYGTWTTFVYAEFENWNQYWNLVWNDDETYAADLRGPWPSFYLIPSGENRYKAVQQGAPWAITDVLVEDNCLIIGSEKACDSGR